MSKKRTAKKVRLMTPVILIIIIGCLLTGKFATKNKNEVKNQKIDEVNEAIVQTTSRVSDKIEIDSKITDWNLILINKDNEIPENYKAILKEVENGFKVDQRILESVKKMLADARQAGVNPWICSSYRTSKTQKELNNKKVNYYLNQGYTTQKSKELASFWVAIPRTSEHEIGIALDIVDRNYQLLNEAQTNTPTQQWLMKNCYQYGFILRYQEKKQEYTMVNHEPWHYRYVGIENAKLIKEKGFCLEEYIEYLKGEKND